MSYDADSFKAGFALGRMLWRPPTMNTGIDTGLGWTADPDYLRFAANTYLGRSNDRNFYKSRDGYAIAVYGVDHGDGQYGYNWYGPFLISTDQNAVRYYYGGTQLTYQGTVNYLGRTWYYNSNHHYQNASYDTGGLQVWTGTRPTKSEVIIAILQAAHVRITA